jgi:hypothetical protein
MPLSDYIINVFCLIDDIYHDLFGTKGVRKAGYSTILQDSELITMLTVGEFLGLSDNKKIWLYFKSCYLSYFPHLVHVKYKIFNKQATNLWCVIRYIHTELLQKFHNYDLYLADGFPLPICHLARCNRCKLFNTQAARGYCAAKDDSYYGFKVLLVTTEQGIPIDYAIDAANIDERELLTRTTIPEQSIIIADKGFISNKLQQQLKLQHDITLLTPTRKNMLNQISEDFSKAITSVRKRIETTISQLTQIFSINKTKARSFHGLLGRINRKILSYTMALFFNSQLVKDQDTFTKLEHLIQA